MLARVKMNILNGPDLRRTFKSLVEEAQRVRPDAEIRGVTVEPMAASADARELMVGVKRDPVFGPVIAFGAGGTMAEILRDNAIAIPPLNRVLAQRLIDRTRVTKLLGAIPQDGGSGQDGSRECAAACFRNGMRAASYPGTGYKPAVCR